MYRCAPSSRVLGRLAGHADPDLPAVRRTRLGLCALGAWREPPLRDLEETYCRPPLFSGRHIHVQYRRHSGEGWV
jgi:hypothetical protein